MDGTMTLDSPDNMFGALNRLVEEHRILERRYRLMKKGLDRAARVQQSLLPTRSPTIAGYEFAHLYQPCEEVGGDFYDYVERGEELVVVVSDVIGHGFEAALTTMLLKEVFGEVAALTGDPVKMLKMMNARLHHAFPEGMFAAAAILTLRANSPCVRFANAGLPYPFFMCPSRGRVEEVELAGFPLGLFNGDVAAEYEAWELSLVPGDTLLVGSDGIHAVAGETGDSFDGARLPGILGALLGRTGQGVLDGLLARLGFDGQQLTDDVNLVAITRVEVPKSISPP
jgi:phosphoserine phosphatase RsbU/P